MVGPDHESGGVWHLGQKDLRFAVLRGQSSPYGSSGAWVWDPVDDFDLTPGKAATLALWSAVGAPVETLAPVFAY